MATSEVRSERSVGTKQEIVETLHENIQLANLMLGLAQSHRSKSMEWLHRLDHGASIEEREVDQARASNRMLKALQKATHRVSPDELPPTVRDGDVKAPARGDLITVPVDGADVEVEVLEARNRGRQLLVVPTRRNQRRRIVSWPPRAQ